eukprot:4556338-Pleurochrysis_carterae.AAC.1
MRERMPGTPIAARSEGIETLNPRLTPHRRSNVAWRTLHNLVKLTRSAASPLPLTRMAARGRTRSRSESHSQTRTHPPAQVPARAP